MMAGWPAQLAASGPVIPDFGGGATDTCVRVNHSFCWGWFRDNWSGVYVPAIEQHVKLTLIALVIGFVMSAALALLAHRLHRLETPITIVSGVLYTIPSLALFQLLVPFTHLTVTTVEIGLVSYTLLILFRNMLEGLRGVPAEVHDAARGMGLTDRQILWRIEIPLALPAMMAGLRIATVTIISLATVAAFVIDEGLGGPIFRAIQSDVFKTELIAAGVLAIAMALVADGALVLVQRILTPWATTRLR
jgi:osmoprotectant transport system permease protein